MRTRACVTLALLCILAGSAVADEDIGTFFERARILKEEGKTGEAIDAFRLVIREWPDNKAYTPKAHLMLAETLAQAGRLDDALAELGIIGERYEGSDALLAQAAALNQRIRQGIRARQDEQERETALAEQLKALEHKLLEQGLSGQELDEAFKAGKKRLEIARQYEDAMQQYLQMRVLWERQGVSPEQIRERVERIEAERTLPAKQQAELEAVARRLAEAGASRAAIERELEARRRAAAGADRGPFKERHDEEMQELRREFIHLAEELGIPGEEAERLLKEHQQDRRRLELGEEHARRPETHLDHRFAEIEERFEEMAMHMERFAQHLEMRNAELTRMVEHLVMRVEELQGEIERVRERREDAVVQAFAGARARANDISAIASLRIFSSAQVQFQATAMADADRDGVGEFGTFLELSGAQDVRGDPRAGSLNPPVLSGAFRAPSKTGLISRSGYNFIIYLPDRSGGGIVADAAGFANVDADLAEGTWCAYAWPVNSDAGKRTYFINQCGDVLATDSPMYRGTRKPLPGAAFIGGGPSVITGLSAADLEGQDGNSWVQVN